jgi:L-rhamnose-H+ transport protein
MTFFIGLLLVIISGAMAGNVLTPIKFMRKYRFENYWLIHSLVGTVIIPWALAIATIPGLFRVYSHLPWSTLLVPPLFAFSWGIASTLGGLCASRIGLSLTYALIIGVGAAAGTLVPLLYFSPGTFNTSAGKFIVLGVAVMVVGLILIARAGGAKEAREKSSAAGEHRSAERGETIQGPFLAGLIMALLAGLLSAGLNFSFAFGQRITAAALAAGASSGNATYAVWPLAMLGGMIPNIAWATIGLVRNKSWHQFRESAETDFPLAVLMGTLFM